MPESTAAPRRVVVFSRHDCCLCDDALAAVRGARRSAEFDWEVVDVDSDPALAERYGEEVPVIEIDGRKAFKYRVTEKQLLAKLGRPRWRWPRARRGGLGQIE